ncbi:DUF2244 domain-containing protein [Octadecabacter sp. G9-8]|uniref:DUF2244 domain-containing protein n=1 Tax=Octadecabacter dasysiphoniae TaxID=2909341 RepID=A0ABS9CYV4_9RHOB|nr:DUF2244 domain-containing protein [Octadecabacter dasysiphoniae]MCF2871972.1 DUF2244 domain-containing protein [Octadecabacter dasysiphoniae]
MPYEWIEPDGKDAPTVELHLWPYRSLLRKDFVLFIGGTCAIVLLPLLVLLGSPVLWALLPFFAIAVGGVWYAINHSYKSGEILEELRIWPDRITLEHIHPRQGRKSWEANPYWVQLKIDPNHDRITNYITLKGADRVVELGAFLPEDERAVVFSELQDRLRMVLNARND